MYNANMSDSSDDNNGVIAVNADNGGGVNYRALAASGAPPPPGVKVLGNGAWFDTERARIVANPGGGIKAFTSDKASLAVQRRIEKKRARLAAGANAVIAEGGKFDGRGLDFVEAIGEALAITALNPDSSQQVKAAQVLLKETGISEDSAPKAADSAVNLGGVSDLVSSLAEFARSVAALRGDNGG